ncbi:MAG TPA: FAD-dependent oxidoreductase [Candidatus Dormibacteraeota bacterium]
MQAERPTVVIVGAGFAGLNCAKALRRAPVRTILVDRNNFHQFSPLLYQVATAALDSSDIAHPVRAVLRKVPNAEFRLAEVQRVDLDRRQLRTDKGLLQYDYLVLACGSTTTYFGNQSVAERSFAMKTLDDSLLLRNRILSRFEAADWAADEQTRKELLTFAIVGGGPAGVECAGALAELISRVLRHDFKELDMRSAEIVLLQSGPALLEPFEPNLRDAARRRLERMGVKVMLNTRVAEVRDGEIQLADGTVMPVGTVIWTAGVEGAGIEEGLEGVPAGARHTLKVGPTLQVQGHPEVFVIGDQAAVEGPGGRQLPQLAPVAMQEAECAAGNLKALVEQRPLRAFRYRDKGIMATVGRGAAVVQSGPLRMRGRLGWASWLFLHLVLIVGFRNRLSVLLNWSWNYFLWDRPVRLVIGASDRRLERLSQLPLVRRALPDLSERDLVAMWNRLRWEWVRPGEVVLRESEPSNSFYIVTSGEVQLDFEEGGAARPSARLGPGGFFGEIGCLTGRSDGTVRALVASEMIVLDRKGLIELLERSPMVRRDVEAQMQRVHDLKYAVR